MKDFGSEGLGYRHDEIVCASTLFDRDVSPAGQEDLSISNDGLEEKRVAGCSPSSSGRIACPSDLHGSLTTKFMEFATPTGIRGFLNQADYRNIWLAAEYPPDFLARSPSTCTALPFNQSTAHYGCQACLDGATASAGVDDPTNQRYCRCMLATDLTQSQLENISEYTAHGCLTGAHLTRNRCFRLTSLDGDTSNCPGAQSDHIAAGALPSHRQSCEPFCTGLGDGAGSILCEDAAGQFYYTSKANCESTGTLIAPTPAPTPSPTPFVKDFRNVTCPVIAMMVKAGDLETNETGFVQQNELFRQFLRVGISAPVAWATVNGNFAHLQATDPSINVFRMNTNTTGSSGRALDLFPGACSISGCGAREHFRSTGIRDDLITRTRFDLLESTCMNTFNMMPGEIGAGPGYKHDEIECASTLYDRDASSDDQPISNDGLEEKRPAGCSKTSSGRLTCPSDLHGSLTFMFMEFATPTGIRAFATRDEYRNMWLTSDYPPGFAGRSPRTCVNRSTDHFGCQACLAEASASSGIDHLPNQRYCRCMLTTALTSSQLENISEYKDHGCLTGAHLRRNRCFRLTSLDGDTSNCPAAESDHIAAGALPSHRQSCEPFCTGLGDGAGSILCEDAAGQFYYTSKANCESTGTLIAPTPAPTPSPTPFVKDFRNVTCPVIAMMVKAGDLETNETGFVQQNELFRQFLRVGISAPVAWATVNGNFAHLQATDPSINVFRMNTNTTGSSGRALDLFPGGCSISGCGAREHFRSTGIRDDLITRTRFDLLESTCMNTFNMMPGEIGAGPGYK